jgi:uncharacterized protein (DUF1697 family)
MPTQIVLLRGINLGARNRIAMPALRELLSGAGLQDVRTYVQSGNVVLRSDSSPQQLARECRQQIVRGFGLEIAVVVRTLDELAEVVRRDPLRDVALDPRRYLVSFLSGEPDTAVVDKLDELKSEPEQFVLMGRECYSWHPDGVGRSRLWTKLSGRGLGVTATARNWATVTALLAIADE